MTQETTNMEIIERAYAFTTGVCIKTNADGTCAKSDFKGWGEYISTFIDYALDIGMALAVLMILYAGVRYLTSQGNPTAISDAKEIITGAIIGFLVLVLIKYILSTLNIDNKEITTSLISLLRAFS